MIFYKIFNEFSILMTFCSKSPPNVFQSAMSRKRKRFFSKPQKYLNPPMNNSEEKFLLRLPGYIKNPRKRSIKFSFRLINFFGSTTREEGNIETSLTTFKVSPARVSQMLIRRTHRRRFKLHDSNKRFGAKEISIQLTQ